MGYVHFLHLRVLLSPLFHILECFRLALNCLGLGKTLFALVSASWVDSACRLAAWALATLFLLVFASWVDSACCLAAWALASLYLLAFVSPIGSDWCFLWGLNREVVTNDDYKYYYQTSYVNSRHIKMCIFSLTGLIFVSSLLHPGLVHTLGFPAFP